MDDKRRKSHFGLDGNSGIRPYSQMTIFVEYQSFRIRFNSYIKMKLPEVHFQTLNLLFLRIIVVEIKL